VREPGTPAIEPETRYHLNDLAHLRQRVTRAADLAGLEPDRVAQLTVAVSEVATNAIQHATGSALVAISRGRDRLTVRVSDDGPGIPTTIPSQGPRPAVDALSGRGLWLVRQFCDQVHIETGNTGTQIQLVMFLTGSDGQRDLSDLTDL
jgi:anti-sigma regulatory factor (Ser/Thr protein kinase)